MSHLEFRLPTTLQPGSSIGPVGAGHDYFGAEEDEVWVIEGKKDDGTCIINAYSGEYSRDVVCVS